MSQVIVFKNPATGNVSVCIPTQEALDLFGIDAIARKDVPAGCRYKIIDETELPQHAPQELWAVDDADLDSGVGAESSEFPPELLRAAGIEQIAPEVQP